MLSELEWFIGDAVALAGWIEADNVARKRRRRRHRRKVSRLLLAGLALLAFAFTLVLRWVAARVVGGIAAIASALRRRKMTTGGASVGAPRLVSEAPRSASTELAPSVQALLPWLARDEESLPLSARTALRELALRVDALATQLRERSEDSSERVALRRLVEEELAELVQGYGRLPVQLTSRSFAGSATPEEQLLAGIAIIAEQVSRLHERAAGAALRALSTHVRYLALKYGADSELELGARVDTSSDPQPDPRAERQQQN